MGGFQTEGFPIWNRPSRFVLSCSFWDFPGPRWSSFCCVLRLEKEPLTDLDQVGSALFPKISCALLIRGQARIAATHQPALGLRNRNLIWYSQVWTLDFDGLNASYAKRTHAGASCLPSVLHLFTSAWWPYRLSICWFPRWTILVQTSRGY